MRHMLRFNNGEDSRLVRLDGPGLSIGRAPENDLVLDHKRVSRRHCVITVAEDQARLQDLDSTCGTRVNDRRRTKCVLNHGDVIRIGPHELAYCCKAEAKAPDPNDEPTSAEAHAGTPTSGVESIGPTARPGATDDAHARIPELEQALQCSEERTASLGAELEAARRCLEARGTELAELVSRLEAADHADEQFRARESELEQARAEAGELAGEREQARAELSSELEALKAELQTSKAELEQARAEAGEFAGERDQARAELSSELEALKSELQTSKAELEQARAEAGELAGEREQARAELSSEVEALRAELQTSKAELEQARAEAGELAGEREQARAELSSEIEALRAELQTSKSELEQARAEAGEFAGEREQARAEMTSEIESLQAELQTSRAELEAAGARAAELATKHEAAERSLADAERRTGAERETAERNAAEAARECARLHDLVRRHEETERKTTKELTRLQRRLKKLESTAQRIRGRGKEDRAGHGERHSSRRPTTAAAVMEQPAESGPARAEDAAAVRQRFPPAIVGAGVGPAKTSSVPSSQDRLRADPPERDYPAWAVVITLILAGAAIVVIAWMRTH